MKKLNKKSDVYYINKSISVPFLNVCKVHLIDDDCNEFTVTLNIPDVSVKTYKDAKVFNKYIIDVKEYDRNEWENYELEVDYARAILRK